MLASTSVAELFQFAITQIGMDAGTHAAINVSNDILVFGSAQSEHNIPLKQTQMQKFLKGGLVVAD